MHGKVSPFRRVRLPGPAHRRGRGLQAIVDSEFVPRARDGDLNAAVLDAVDAVQERVAPDTVPLTMARVLNAAIGLTVAPLALLAILWLSWPLALYGDDP